MRSRLLSALVVLGHLSLLAQVGKDAFRSEPTQKSVRIQKLENSPVRVDGELNEPVWQTLPPITDLVQTQPDLGSPVSERTEIRIFHDDKNIYFGFSCFDREPEKIVARLGAHDGMTGSDSVNILIDTFNDRRTGYFFSINSRGIQFDALANEGRGNGFEQYDQTWDGIWDSAATLHQWGYSVEVAIPFKSIRIPDHPGQTWGLNVSRDIVRKNENAYWQPVTRYDEVMKPSKAGTMSGVEGGVVGRRLELIPFAMTSYRQAPWVPQLDGWDGSGGLDARYGLTSNITATATLNPDFGDTEADEFTPTISRFEIFFPEKRKFFTEGANYFQTPMQLFFSRRIGALLPDGVPQSIIEGTKVTGQTGRWVLGALETYSRQQEFIDPIDGRRKTAPANFFGVARLQRKIFSKSALGFITVNRLQDRGDYGEQQSTQAVDLQILHGEHITWQSQGLVNLNDSNPGVDWQHTGFQSNFQYNSDRYELETGGRFLGEKTRFDYTGFEPEIDRWVGWMSATYKPFINRWGMRQIFVNTGYDEANGSRGELQDSGAEINLRVQFKNFWNLYLNHDYDRVRFDEFTSDQQPILATRIYTVPRHQVELATNENRPVALDVRFQTGKMVQFDERFYGFQKTLDLGLKLRIAGNARLEFRAIRVNESLQSRRHYQNRDYIISRLTYQFTPKMRARVLTQYFQDKYGHNFSVNSLFAYDFTARSGLFVGYNRQKRSPLDPSDIGNQFYVKLSYLFRL